MLPKWLVSTPIRTYAHPATPLSIPLGVDTASSMHRVPHNKSPESIADVQLTHKDVEACWSISHICKESW